MNYHITCLYTVLSYHWHCFLAVYMSTFQLLSFNIYCAVLEKINIPWQMIICILRLLHQRGPGRRRRSHPGSTVRFYDDMDADSHIHGMHRDIRDIGSEQLRLEDDLGREIERRNKSVSTRLWKCSFVCVCLHPFRSEHVAANPFIRAQNNCCHVISQIKGRGW